ncbi:MAG: crossover junction endodeoxyribonuclease RuvC [bacterium]
MAENLDSPLTILGIDPGVAEVGYGLIRTERGNSRSVAYGVITTTPKETLPLRLKRIYDELSEVVRTHKPDMVAVEQLFFAANVKTAVGVAQGRGVAVLAAGQSGAEVFEYTPLQIKQAVAGYGRASKLQVQQMVRAILSLSEIPKPDHAADALAVALCHAHSLKSRRIYNAVRRAK